jgi:excisionase family DNA binding protein
VLKSQGYVRVREAATLLGVSANTIRNWGADGKLPEYRHPVNNHRLFKRADLESIMEELEASVKTRTKPQKPKKPR